MRIHTSEDLTPFVKQKPASCGRGAHLAPSPVLLAHSHACSFTCGLGLLLRSSRRVLLQQNWKHLLPGPLQKVCHLCSRELHGAQIGRPARYPCGWVTAGNISSRWPSGTQQEERPLRLCTGHVSTSWVVFSGLVQVRGRLHQRSHTFSALWTSL